MHRGSASILLALVAWGTRFHWFFVLWAALLVCGWVPLVLLIFAAGYRRGAAVLAILGDIWSVVMGVLIGMLAEPSGQVAPGLPRELAAYALVGGSIGALLGTVYAVWRWRAARHRWLIAGIGAAALAGVSCAPALGATGLGRLGRELIERGL
jgi:hypothetical protein